MIYVTVFRDINSVVQATGSRPVKVIIETCLLTKQQIIDASLLTVLAGAHFIKTSTGFSTGGARVDDVALMKAIAGETVQVKASGGIRDYETSLQMLRAGATRLGVSAGIAIVNGEQQAAVAVVGDGTGSTERPVNGVGQQQLAAGGAY